MHEEKLDIEAGEEKDKDGMERRRDERKREPNKLNKTGKEK